MSKVENENKNFLHRTALLIGMDGVELLKNSSILVIGLGGVGGACAEAIVRSGVGHVGLCDFDSVDITNINRQILATTSVVGANKTDVARARMLEINPTVHISTYPYFIDDSNIDMLNIADYDFVIDACDSVPTKILLAKTCQELGVSIISCMGTGDKLYPERFEIADIYSSSVCPLARSMRKKLKAANIKKLDVLYSREEPVRHSREEGVKAGSISFTPPVAGYILAAHAVRKILEKGGLLCL